jgi:hypothetical protein
MSIPPRTILRDTRVFTRAVTRELGSVCKPTRSIGNTASRGRLPSGYCRSASRSPRISTNSWASRRSRLSSPEGPWGRRTRNPRFDPDVCENRTDESEITNHRVIEGRDSWQQQRIVPPSCEIRRPVGASLIGGLGFPRLRPRCILRRQRRFARSCLRARRARA